MGQESRKEMVERAIALAHEAQTAAIAATTAAREVIGDGQRATILLIRGEAYRVETASFTYLAVVQVPSEVIG